jgi:uncharacterized protein YraI
MKSQSGLRALGHLLLLVLALALPAAVWAQVAYTTQAVNMRAGPDREYPQVAWLPSGVAVNVIGCIEDYRWCDVVAGPNRGWVYARFLSYPYQNQPMPIISGGAVLGLPLITFSIGPYWDNYYRGSPWYGNRSYWYNRPEPQPYYRAAPRYESPPYRQPDYRQRYERQPDSRQRYERQQDYRQSQRQPDYRQPSQQEPGYARPADGRPTGNRSQNEGGQPRGGRPQQSAGQPSGNPPASGGRAQGDRGPRPEPPVSTNNPQQ